MPDVNNLLQKLVYGSKVEQRTAALQLGAMRNPLLVPDLLRAADTSDESLRSCVASALAASVDVEALRPALAHHSIYVRLTGVAALRHMPGDAARALLYGAAQKDPDPQVRAAAAAALHTDT